jgi:hypothetical protein
MVHDKKIGVIVIILQGDNVGDLLRTLFLCMLCEILKSHQNEDFSKNIVTCHKKSKRYKWTEFGDRFR